MNNAPGISAILGGVALGIGGMCTATKGQRNLSLRRREVPAIYALALWIGALALLIGGVNAILSREQLAGVAATTLGVVVATTGVTIWFRNIQLAARAKRFWREITTDAATGE